LQKSFKKIALKGVIWTAIEKGGTQILGILITIFLARLISPSEFGILGLLAIIISVSQLLVDSGLGSALIQCNNREEIDFHTVFLFNFTISVLIYIIIYFSSPTFSVYFSQPKLAIYARVLGLIIIINALGIIPRTLLTINLDFSSVAKSNLIGTLVGGILGIISAYFNLGVWSLIIQMGVTSILSLVSLYFFLNWRPIIVFSKNSFLKLYKFSSFLLLSGLYGELLKSVYPTIVGKLFPISSLGYFTKANQLSDASTVQLVGIIQQVSFPILSSVQNDTSRLLFMFKKIMGMTFFLTTPLICLLVVLSRPLILLIFTPEWENMIIMFQLFLISRIFYPLSSLNLALLNVIGRSDLFFKIELLKFPLTLFSLLFTIKFGISAILFGYIINSFLSYAINSYYTNLFFNYGMLSQLSYLLKYLILSIVMSLFVFWAVSYLESNIVKIFIGILLGFITYTFSLKVLKTYEFFELLKLLKSLKKSVV